MSLFVNGVEIESVISNGSEMESMFYNGIEVFSSARAVTYSLTNLVQISCPTSVRSGGTLIAKIGAVSGYLTPETIQVNMDGTALTTTNTNTSYYNYDANTGTITVYNCVGAINIIASTNLQYSTLWTFSSNSVTRYNGSANNITIPYCYKSFTRNNTTYYVVSESSISGYTNVTKIADSMFYGVTTIRSVTTLSPLSTIGAEAFRGCTNLQTITSASVSSVGNYAFYGCTSLTSFNRNPSTVGNYAFYNCYNMIYGTSGSFSFYNVGAYAFWNCNNLTGTATESTTVASGASYSIGAFAFAKTNITKFDLSKVNSKAKAAYGEGCFSSNSAWTYSLNIGNSYNPICVLVSTSTSSSNAGTYKYIYGGYMYGSSARGQIVSGDYVPPVYVYAFWGNQSWNSYCENITTSSMSASATCFTLSSSSSAGFTFRAECRNASTSTSTFKSAYANVRYYTMRDDPNAVVAKNESTYTEVGSMTPVHGVAYWWYPYSYVTAQSSGCIAFDTPIALADGTTKMIQDITFKDRILRFNHDTGEIDSSYCHWINKEEIAGKYYKVTFSDDSEIKFIFPHSIYSLDDNCYVSITDNEHFHEGTRVAKQCMKNGQIKLTEVSVTTIEVIFEEIHYCEVLTPQYLNCFANNILVTEPFTTGFQNMYGFNGDLTYKSPIRKQYLDGEYQGQLFSHEYTRDTLRISFKDDYGFRAEEWGMLMEKGLIDEPNIHDMIDNFVNSPTHKLDTIKDEDGDNIWPVTTDDNILENIDNHMYKEQSNYILPTPKVADGFLGWCCSADNKIYQPGQTYVVKYGTHFSVKKEVK